MFYVLMEAGRAISAQTEFPRTADDRFDARFENRNDWKTFERATEVAAQLTESTGILYIPTDSGPNVSPRYDVIAAPVLGMKVSKYFNGDAYPEGEIVKISASLKRVVTSTGAVFFRRKNSGLWLEGGTWGMISGHESMRNPSF